jgi:pSer/pThr/pTyr-binding forkhead associated (FHA) protein
VVNQSPSQGTLVLVIDGEIQPDAIYPLSSTEKIVIGRDSGCDISLDFDANISRLHATIEPLKPDGWQIVDHNSANGTYINGERLQGKQILHPGDQLMFSQGGPEFIFEYRVPPGIATEESQLEVVAPRQTIESSKYRLEVFPRRLIIEPNPAKIGSFWRNVSDKVLAQIILLIYAYIMAITITTFPTNIIGFVIFSIIFFIPGVISYQLDVDAQQLTITSRSLFDKLFGIRRYRNFPLKDFTGVRLQRTITEDGGSRYHDYTIELLRVNGVPLPLNFRWRQSFGFNPFKNRIAEADRLVAEANELIDWIQKYLEHS